MTEFINKSCRDEIIEFATAMEFRLKQNDNKKSWKHSKNTWLIERLVDNLNEMQKSLINLDTIKVSECLVDIANYSMMIRDNILNMDD